MAQFRSNVERIFSVRPAEDSCHFCSLPQPQLLPQWFYELIISNHCWFAVNICIGYIRSSTTCPGWLLWNIPEEHEFLLPAKEEESCIHEKDNTCYLLILSRGERKPQFVCSTCRRYNLPEQDSRSPTPSTLMGILSISTSIRNLWGDSLIEV